MKHALRFAILMLAVTWFSDGTAAADRRPHLDPGVRISLPSPTQPGDSADTATETLAQSAHAAKPMVRGSVPPAGEHPAAALQPFSVPRFPASRPPSSTAPVRPSTWCGRTSIPRAPPVMPLPHPFAVNLHMDDSA